MKERILKLGEMPIIGIRGEHGVTRIRIDAGDLIEALAGGTHALICRRGDGHIYPIVSEIGEDGYVSAVLEASETAIAGRIEFELYWFVDGDLAKSRIYSARILKSLEEPGDPPDEPGEGWIEQVIEQVEDAVPSEGSDGQVLTRRSGRNVWESPQGGGGGGTSDHTQLTNRDAANQHPISAINGLQTALDGKGTYTKPSGGIPKSDLASAVQTSLGLADSALQSESDPVFAASPAHGITSANISGWNAKYAKPSSGIPKSDLASSVQTSLGLADSALQTHQSLAAYRTSSAQDTIDAGKQDKLIAGSGISISSDGKTISATGGGGADANAVHYTAETKTEAQKAQARKNIDVVREIHNYDFGGKRLNDLMTAAEFAAAIAADDWSNIKVGDYWEITLNGSYHDWGDVRLPAGHTYYSDAALTTPAGTAASELAITPVLAQYGTVSVGGTTYYVPSWDCSGVVVTKGAKYYSSSNFATQVGTTTRSYAGTANSAGYISFQIGGTTYYAKPEDCHGARIKSLNNAVMKYEIGGINPYWRYGDSGALSGDVPHVVLIPRDCLPLNSRMRRGNKSASWSADQVAGVLTANQAADGTRKSFTFTKSSSVSLPFAAQFFAGGVEVEMSSTEISGNTVTCAVGTAPASGATITCRLLNINDAWHLTAAYHTLNDPDLGVLPLIKSALGATLAAKIYENTNGDGMRIYTDTKVGAGAAAVGGAFYNRGVLFMPTETEVWGAKIQSDTLSNKFLAQLPIFAGSNRHRTKGVGNGSSRSSWWFGSAVSNAGNWCGCSTNGYPVTNTAGNTGGVAPSFILTA